MVLSTAGRTGTCFRRVPGLFPKQILDLFQGTRSRKTSVTMERKPDAKDQRGGKNHRLVGLSHLHRTLRALEG